MHQCSNTCCGKTRRARQASIHFRPTKKRQDKTCKTSKHSFPPCSTQKRQTQKKKSLSEKCKLNMLQTRPRAPHMQDQTAQHSGVCTTHIDKATEPRAPMSSNGLQSCGLAMGNTWGCITAMGVSATRRCAPTPSMGRLSSRASIMRSAKR